jgi:superoxide dismutase, Fe-Mn family
MKRRTFIQTSLLGGAATLLQQSKLISKTNLIQTIKEQQIMPFKLSDLPYAYDALEPYIDKMTMEIHHDKHHAAYATNFNKALEGTEWDSKTIEEIFKNVSKLPMAVRNNGGGYHNHLLYWNNMKPKGGGMPIGELATAIDRDFGAFDKFKEQFSNAGMTRFGSGWAWLIAQHGKLIVTSTPNQDNPLMNIVEVKGIPLLTMDVWEHAYYLKYQNRRADYISAFWNVINWDEVAKRFASAK